MISKVLTGATGSLGVHILELLRSSDHVQQIICLIRASDYKEARERVSKSLARRNKSALAILKERIICVPTDFLRSDLGLTPQLLEYIQQKATHIIHVSIHDTRDFYIKSKLPHRLHGQ